MIVRSVCTGLVAVLLTLSFAHADDGGKGKGRGQTHGKGMEEGPCKKVREACEAAGFFKKGHKEKKGLMLDCIKPLLDGQAVAGVSVTPEDLSACKEKKKEYHEKAAERHAKAAEKK